MSSMPRVHVVIEGLRSRFGERMRYVFRHFPVARKEATPAAELAEYAAKRPGSSGMFTKR